MMDQALSGDAKRKPTRKSALSRDHGGNALRALIAFTCAVMIGASAPARAEYPTRQVTIVIPFAPGSVTDAAARLLAHELQDALGQPFVVENKAGGGGLIAASTVARAQPDGHTLLVTTNTTHSAAQGLFKNVPYDPIKDFDPVARIGSFPSFVAVNPSLPIRSMSELVAYAKANPGKLEYGHGNSTGQIVGEAIKHRTGIDVVRVAYRSNPAAITDLIAGHIAMMIPDFGTGLEQLRAGKVRALAVPTKVRNGQMPDVPTLDETVMPGFDVLAWVGMFAPAGTPPDAVDRLAAEVGRILARPEMQRRLVDSGTNVFYTGPAEFRAYVKSELAKWLALIREAGIEPE
jgi:tripartite-type tricarboxylate transporter receptor subunit TctC